LPLFFFHGTTTLVSLGFLIIEGSRSLSDSPHSVGLPWTSDQLDAETSTQHSQGTDIHARRDSKPQLQQVNGCKPTP